MRPELWLRVMADATPTRLTLTALVGKQPKATNPRISAYGYKPKIRAPRFTSAFHPAPDIRTLNFRSWRHCGRALYGRF